MLYIFGPLNLRGDGGVPRGLVQEVDFEPREMVLGGNGLVPRGLELPSPLKAP